MAQSSGREMNQGHSDNLEDERGIDVSQIRAQLRLSVPERVRTMVAAANTMSAMREAAQTPPVVD